MTAARQQNFFVGFFLLQAFDCLIQITFLVAGGGQSPGHFDRALFDVCSNATAEMGSWAFGKTVSSGNSS